MSKQLPKSLRKFLRKEKVRIRKTIFNSLEVEEKIKEIAQKLISPYENSGKK